MTVLTDSRYAALARTAAAALGSSSGDVVRGILSQWQCEGQKQYPPARNNPGNIARGLANDLGLAYTVGANAPQPGNPIVTFATPEIGANAYAKAIASMSRYHTALLAARRGDGLGFVRAIGSSGWGTGLNCMLGVYRGKGTVGGGPNLPTGPGGSGTPTGTLTDYTACQAALTKLGISIDAKHVITKGEATTMVASQNPNFHPGDLIFDQAVSYIVGKRIGDYCASDFINASPVPTVGGGGVSLNGISIDFSKLIDPQLVINLGVVGIAAYLVLTGIRDVLGGSAGDAALLA